MIRAILVIVMTFILSACSSINSQFDCPMKEGIRCESIQSVNARVDRGEIGNNHLISNTTNPVIHPITYKDSTFIKNNYSLTGEPLRYSETVMRVWLAPFEDKEGNYHQESDIYTITRNGKWIGAPLKEINENGE
jgi:conjugal transfer pilus assembly protein TraV